MKRLYMPNNRRFLQACRNKDVYLHSENLSDSLYSAFRFSSAFLYRTYVRTPTGAAGWWADDVISAFRRVRTSSEAGLLVWLHRQGAWSTIHQYGVSSGMTDLIVVDDSHSAPSRLLLLIYTLYRTYVESAPYVGRL